MFRSASAWGTWGASALYRWLRALLLHVLCWGMCSAAVVCWVCLSCFVFSAARGCSLCFSLYLVIAGIMERAADVLELPYQSGVG